MQRRVELTAERALSAALTAHRSGKWEIAQELYEQILARQPDNVLAVLNCGLLHQQRGALPEACRHLARAAVLAPEAVTQLKYGECLLALGDAPAAEAQFVNALRLEGENPEAQYGLARSLMAQEQWEAAQRELIRAVVLQPERVGWRHELSLLLLKRNRAASAIQELKQALTIAPNETTLLTTRAHALLRHNRVEEAIQDYQLARENGDASAVLEHNLALAELYAGDFARGLEHFEARHRLPGSQVTAFGFELNYLERQDPRGLRILVYPEQGLGDAIQFARYVPMLQARGARIFLGCPDTLVTLFRSLGGVESLVHGSQLPECDLQCPMLSLPRYFGTRYQSIPADVPYLRAPDNRLQFWKRRLMEQEGTAAIGKRLPRVGLVWAGNPDHPDDHNRSLELEQLKGFLQLARPACGPPLASLYSLQVGRRTEQLNTLPEELRPHDLGTGLRDFSDTAALVEQMDLMVCVDTSVAHLVGALGRPLWLLLPFRTDWRWGPTGSATPWYPSARLFRQSKPPEGCPQQWESALAQLETAFTRWLAEHSETDSMAERRR